ncbi:hypothetical protein AVEN_264855-1 [Araneus ventricosus]|uniref:Uncharacterized protein n=1 Tax=Araneus ventricosus TaxID=182803 RepID=A0A4Y2L4M6_ARAVE|nr:hypothetical protein AVEN_264855-1 [Araneus ventricosus]
MLALKQTCPQRQHFLCIFYVGQAVWCFLWDSKFRILNNYRRQLMSHFQQIMYVETPTCSEQAYLNAVGFGKAVKRLEKITSEGQWETMLATLGNNVRLKKKAGIALWVQPTSTARRLVGVTRGRKRVANGRPSIGSQVSKKEA